MGHLESALHLVHYYSNGIPGALPVVPADAQTWSKFIIFETNQEYAAEMQQALKYALQTENVKSLVHYAVAAAIGSELAAYNAGHLTNELSSFTKNEVQMEQYFWNQSIQSQHVPIHKVSHETCLLRRFR